MKTAISKNVNINLVKKGRLAETKWNGIGEREQTNGRKRERRSAVMEQMYVWMYE